MLAHCVYGRLPRAPSAPWDKRSEAPSPKTKMLLDARDLRAIASGALITDPSAMTTSKSAGGRSMSSNRSIHRNSAAMPLIRQIRRTSSTLSGMISVNVTRPHLSEGNGANAHAAADVEQRGPWHERALHVVVPPADSPSHPLGAVPARALELRDDGGILLQGRPVLVCRGPFAAHQGHRVITA